MYRSIAIDGPSGAGKSTVAKLLSSKLGYVYIDTGAMFRAIALYFDRLDSDKDIESSIKEYIDDIHISICYKDGTQKIYLEDEDVSDIIRQERIGELASQISVHKEVRDKLLELQRRIAASCDVVMDGRDIGTKVLPDAFLKIYLTASSSVRAERRYNELIARGLDADIVEVEKDIIKRDERDMNRAVAPLKKAEDAYEIDSSDKSLEEVVSEIMALAQRI